MSEPEIVEPLGSDRATNLSPFPGEALPYAKASLPLLDCTFRDGGYQTNWDFPKRVVTNYLQAMSAAGIERVELGFRARPTSGYRGLFFYSPESLIDSATELYGGSLGVMVDAKDYLSAPDFRFALRRAFGEAASSALSFVRVAAAPEEFQPALQICDELKDLGYEVHLNIMRISEVEEEVLVQMSSNQDLQTLAFSMVLADTFGAMTPRSFSSLCERLAAVSHMRLGVHAHNNRGLAVANALACLEGGASLVDSTMTGIGRGPGNAETESVMACLSGGADALEMQRQVAAVVKSAVIDFEPLKASGVWGYSPLYLEGSRHSIHPTYLQELSSSSLSVERRWRLLEDLAHYSGRGSFSPLTTVPSIEDVTLAPENGEQPANASKLGDRTIVSLRDSELRGRASGNPLVILGPGRALQDHSDALGELMSSARWPVLDASGQSLAASPHVWKVASHGAEPAIVDDSLGSWAGYVVESPRDLSAWDIQVSVDRGQELIFFPREVASGSFHATLSGCRIPSNLNGPYAVALGVALKPSVIYLFGFDGTTDDDTFWEMGACLQWAGREVAVESLTPTRFPVAQTSVYALLT